MIFEALRSLLIADPQLQPFVGDRVRFITAPASQPLPDIVQYPSSGAPLDETLAGADAPWTRRISFEVRAKTHVEAWAVGEHVLRVLNNHVGRVGNDEIQACRVVSDVELEDETSAIKRRVLDFRVTHAPAT